MRAEADALASAHEVVSYLRSRPATFSARSALPNDVVNALLSAGLYRLCLPAELGGAGSGLLRAVADVEATSKADGSVGWCLAVANGSASLLAGLDRAEAAAVASDRERLCIAGGFGATGRAVDVGDAFEVSGRWSFASGCTAATWILGGVRMFDQAGWPQGEPRVAFFPAGEARVVPNWDVPGLRATGSHDVIAEGIVVPKGRTCTLGGPRWSEDPIARIPFFTLGAMLTAATVLGIAQHALDEIVEVAQTKVHFGRQSRLADEDAFQAELASVTGGLRAARAYLFGHAETIERIAGSGSVPTATQAEAFLVAGAVRDAGLRAVTFAHEAGGTTSIRSNSVLNQCLQDVLVATRHVALTRTPAAAAGRVLLGQGPQPPVLC